MPYFYLILYVWSCLCVIFVHTESLIHLCSALCNNLTPPLSGSLVVSEMDVFDFSLYSMLTLMSCISLLLYLEQCVFIYKKLPTPKKSTLIWTSGAAPVSIRARFVIKC